MNRKTLAGDRRRRKLITPSGRLVLAAVVITLIYLERTAILYILCTLGVTALLLIVAFSDLAHADRRGRVDPGRRCSRCCRQGKLKQQNSAERGILFLTTSIEVAYVVYKFCSTLHSPQ